MKGILITTYYDTQTRRELLICENDEAKEIMEGKIDLDLYSGDVLEFYKDEDKIKIKFADRRIEYEYVSNIYII